MSEIQSVKWLRALLGVHLNWHGARLEFLARFILALLQGAHLKSRLRQPFNTTHIGP
ncbi:MAG: hypothetical protein MZV65_24625 [Chromatiales bacterium]|nr:hypothetical protein [Chromatiales bacterium]